MNTYPTILASQSAKIEALCRNLGAKRLDLFGSAARGQLDADTNDLDFVVDLPATSPADYAQRYFALKEGLEALCGRQVDLVTRAALVTPYLRSRIARESVLVFASPQTPGKNHGPSTTLGNERNEAPVARHTVPDSCGSALDARRKLHDAPYSPSRRLQ